MIPVLFDRFTHAPGTSPTLEPEWSLLRAACSASNKQHKSERIRGLLASPVRWQALFDLAHRHSVQPLLCQTLFNFPELIPSEQTNRLEQSFQANLHKSLLLSRELIRIVDHLTTKGIEVMPYKGLALAEALYGDIALRQSGDLDLLVRAPDLPRIREAVRDLGYTPQLAFSDVEGQAYLRSGYEYVFDGAAGPNLLEVQWAIQPRFYAVDFDMDSLFQDAARVKVAGYPIKTPCEEDLFVMLALHAAKHVWARLIWACDLERIMGSWTLNWQAIGSEARALGIVRILRVTLLLANRLLEAPIPPAAEANLPPDSAASELADEIERHVRLESTHPVESLAYFRLMLALRERPADQLRFLSRLAFTPGPGEWAAVRLPRRLFPLYRMVRLSRLAARLVRARTPGRASRKLLTG